MHGYSEDEDEDADEKDGAEDLEGVAAGGQSVSDRKRPRPAQDDEETKRKPCFLRSCLTLNACKSKFCSCHKSLTDAMRKQAVKDGALDTYNEVTADPDKAEDAVETYRRSSTDHGTYSRRPLID